MNVRQVGCQLPAVGSQLPATTGLSELQWSDIAVGLLVRRKEANSSEMAQQTWMPVVFAGGGGVLLLADCAPGQTPQHDSTAVHWQCYRRPAQLGRTMWQKTAALLRSLSQLFPARRFYIKADTDTLLVPGPLLRFLRHVEAQVRDEPAYVGLAVSGPATSKNNTLCLEPHCLFGTEAWRALSEAAQRLLPRRHSTSSPSVDSTRRSATVHYAAGALYGFNAAALQALVRTDCIASAAAAFNQFMVGPMRMRLFEDEAVGLCMHMHAVPLYSCRCFHGFSPLSPCASRPASKACISRMCAQPISVHPIKVAAQFLAAWRALMGRESLQTPDG
jgi:hypothetical protein